VGQRGSRNASDEPRLIERPAPGSPDRNAVIDGSRSYAPRQGKERFNANITAIRLMRTLEAEGRNATPAEKETLLAYTGWGWMKEAFNKVRAAKWDRYVAGIRERYDYAKQRWDQLQQNRYYSYAPDPGTWESYLANELSTEGYDEENRKLKSWFKNYGEAYEQLRAELTEEEFDSAAKSVRNAHYTDVPVIAAMWRLVDRLGFKGGNATEPGAGIGHFVGAQPGHLADRTKWNAVELDDVTARILSHLYPEVTVNGERPQAGRKVSGLGFQSARIPNGSQDLVISNVPFAKEGPAQSEKEFGTKFNLHNYFFARAFAKAKPGGLVVFITSNSTLDNNLEQRQALAKMGDLVGAIRLPNNAFKANAGTEVTTDILVFRKPDGTQAGFETAPWTFTREISRVPMTSTRTYRTSIVDWMRQQPQGWVPEDPAVAEAFEEWTNARRPASGQRLARMVRAIEDTGDTFSLTFSAPVTANEYWLSHPEHALGQHSLDGSMYGPDAYTLSPNKGSDLIEELNQAINTFPENIAGAAGEETGSERLSAGRNDKMGAFVERDGEIYQVEPDGLTRPEWANDPKKARAFSSWSKLRDAFNNVDKLPGISKDQIRGYGGGRVDGYTAKVNEADMAAAGKMFELVTDTVKVDIMKKASAR
jgi:hypothetical protein